METRAQEIAKPMDKSELIRRIEASDKVHAETMEENPTEIVSEQLSFYKKFKLIRVIVRLPQRPLQFRYADDGKQAFVLGATPEHIYKLNLEDGLRLRVEQVPAYARFFFENTNAGSLKIVESDQDFRWRQTVGGDATAKDLQQRARQIVHPVRVEPLPESGGFRAVANAVRRTTLMEMSLRVSLDGHVQVESERTLAVNLPVVEVAW